MAKRKARRKHEARSGTCRQEQFRCATCGVELIVVVHMNGEFFCSGFHAENFFKESTEQPATLPAVDDLCGS